VTITQTNRIVVLDESFVGITPSLLFSQLTCSELNNGIILYQTMM